MTKLWRCHYCKQPVYFGGKDGNEQLHYKDSKICSQGGVNSWAETGNDV